MTATRKKPESTRRTNIAREAAPLAPTEAQTPQRGASAAAARTPRLPKRPVDGMALAIEILDKAGLTPDSESVQQIARAYRTASEVMEGYMLSAEVERRAARAAIRLLQRVDVASEISGRNPGLLVGSPGGRALFLAAKALLDPEPFSQKSGCPLDYGILSAIEVGQHHGFSMRECAAAIKATGAEAREYSEILRALRRWERRWERRWRQKGESH